MVLAANPFGDIHIAPFATILAQVKKLFRNEFACVLDPPRYIGLPKFGPSIHADSPYEGQTSDRIVSERAEARKWEPPEPRFLREGKSSETEMLLLQEPEVGISEQTSPRLEASSSWVEAPPARTTTPPSLPDESTVSFLTTESDKASVPPLSSSHVAPLLSETPIEAEREFARMIERGRFKTQSLRYVVTRTQIQWAPLSERAVY